MCHSNAFIEANVDMLKNKCDLLIIQDLLFQDGKSNTY